MTAIEPSYRFVDNFEVGLYLPYSHRFGAERIVGYLIWNERRETGKVVGEPKSPHLHAKPCPCLFESKNERPHNLEVFGHPVFIGLDQRLLRGPTAFTNSPAGTDQPGALTAVLAVNKHPAW